MGYKLTQPAKPTVCPATRRRVRAANVVVWRCRVVCTSGRPANETSKRMLRCDLGAASPARGDGVPANAKRCGCPQQTPSGVGSRLRSIRSIRSTSYVERESQQTRSGVGAPSKRQRCGLTSQVHQVDQHRRRGRCRRRALRRRRRAHRAAPGSRRRGRQPRLVDRRTARRA